MGVGCWRRFVQSKQQAIGIIPVGNNTKHDIILPQKTTLGKIQPIVRVVDTYLPITLKVKT